MPHTQQQIIDDLAAALIQDGSEVEYEIQTEMGVIDLITPTTAYEVNAVLTPEKLLRAVTHIVACRDVHNPQLRAVVVAGRADGNLEFVDTVGTQVHRAVVDQDNRRGQTVVNSPRVYHLYPMGWAELSLIDWRATCSLHKPMSHPAQ